MFAPLHGVNEDHVCGSAHCILGPYWAPRADLKNDNDVMHARQVSKRGGLVDVVWDRQRGVCRLQGRVRLAAKGELYL